MLKKIKWPFFTSSKNTDKTLVDENYYEIIQTVNEVKMLDQNIFKDKQLVAMHDIYLLLIKLLEYVQEDKLISSDLRNSAIDDIIKMLENEKTK